MWSDEARAKHKVCTYHFGQWLLRPLLSCGLISGRWRSADSVHRRDLSGVCQHAARLSDLLSAAVHLSQHAEYTGERKRAAKVHTKYKDWSSCGSVWWQNCCGSFLLFLPRLCCVILNGKDSELSLIQKMFYFKSRAAMIHIFRQNWSSPMTQAVLWFH